MERKYAILMHVSRDGYNPDQVRKTLTVGELIEYLQEMYFEDTPIYTCHDNGYTYGGISKNDFIDVEYDENRVYGKEGW